MEDGIIRYNFLIITQITGMVIIKTDDTFRGRCHRLGYHYLVICLLNGNFRAKSLGKYTRMYVLCKNSMKFT